MNKRQQPIKLNPRLVMILVAAALAAGCAQRNVHLSLAHHVDVPKQWRAGRETPPFEGFSTIERYVGAYERGWWWCVRQHAKDIETNEIGYTHANGWAEEADGWEDGVHDADTRIENLIHKFGKMSVTEFLARFRNTKDESGQATRQHGAKE